LRLRLHHRVTVYTHYTGWVGYAVGLRCLRLYVTVTFTTGGHTWLRAVTVDAVVTVVTRLTPHCPFYVVVYVYAAYTLRGCVYGVTRRTAHVYRICTFTGCLRGWVNGCGYLRLGSHTHRLRTYGLHAVAHRTYRGSHVTHARLPLHVTHYTHHGLRGLGYVYGWLRYTFVRFTRLVAGLVGLPLWFTAVGTLVPAGCGYHGCRFGFGSPFPRTRFAPTFTGSRRYIRGWLVCRLRLRLHGYYAHFTRGWLHVYHGLVLPVYILRCYARYGTVYGSLPRLPSCRLGYARAGYTHVPYAVWLVAAAYHRITRCVATVVWLTLVTVT